MSRFDVHIHLFEHGFDGQQPADAELVSYLRMREQYGIDRALVVGYEGSPEHIGNNAYILSLAAAHDWIVPLWFLNPATATAQEIRHARGAGARGFSLYLDGQQPSLDDLAVDARHALSSEDNLFSINAAPQRWQAVADLAAEFSGSRILLSHLGLPGASVQGHDGGLTNALTALVAHPNVLIKLSGLYAIDPAYPHPGAAEYARAVIDVFGADRIVWGSDFSPGLSAVSEAELFTIPPWATDLFTPEELHRVQHALLPALLPAPLPARADKD